MSQSHIYELCLFREGAAEMRFPLTTQRIRLGKAVDCDLSLDDEAIHGEHAVLYFARGAWWLHPCGGEVLAPIQVNGTLIETDMTLEPEMAFQVGSWQVQFRESTLEITDPNSTEDPFKGTTKLLETMGQSRDSASFVLRWTDSDQLPCEFKLKQERVLIGKSKLCDLILQDDYVSSRHAEIYFDGTAVHLRDMNSTNGTQVNGMQVKQVQLEEGSEIICGKTTLLFAKCERLRRSGERRYPWTVPLLGQSPAFDHLAKQIERVAPLAQNVFIHGDTGTGKELVAAALHELSNRSTGPFMAINCGAISKELMESELFGHEKGAFTGAQQRRAGAFELASGGTLFLDEIGELPLDLQPKLLRVLETGRFRRLGGHDELKVNVRVFSATHRNLSEAIRKGRFREDLYYRLYILPVEVPPLRERLDDIELLTTFFVAQACPPGQSVEIHPDVSTLLKEYPWPGNIRELRNLLYRALAFCEERMLRPEHFFPFLDHPYSARPSDGMEIQVELAPLNLSPIKAKERETIVEILKGCRGNQSEAAKQLGIGRTTLYYKLKEYGIDLRRQVTS